MKKEKKKKGTILLLGLIVIISGWWITRSASSAGTSSGVIDVWVTWGEDPDTLLALLDRFSQESGVPVQVRSRVRSDRLEQALAGDEPPDLAILSASDLVGSLDQQGLVQPLDGWIAAKGIDLADIYPAALAPCRMSDGSIACLPWGADVYALFWNKVLFEEAGLDPDRPPATLEELADWAERLTRRDEEGELQQIGFLPDLGRSHTDLYLHLFGGSWTDEETDELTINTQPMIDALTWQQQFYESSGTESVREFALSLNRYMRSSHPVYAGERSSCRQCHPTATLAKAPDSGFLGGEVAMMVDGQWQAVCGQASFEVGVAPVPPAAGHPERANSNGTEGPVVIMAAGAADRATAADLLAWMMTPKVVAQQALAMGKVPTGRAAAEDPRFREMPDFEVFLDLMADPNVAHRVSTPLGPALNEAIHEVEQAVLRDGADAAAFLKRIQAESEPQWEGALATERQP